jgi:cell wall-associated NlpC family hydrolase
MNPIQLRIRPWLLGAAALALALTLNPQGASAKAAELPTVRTVVDGRLLTYDVPAVVQDNRTLVPMRGFLIALGATIDWNQDTQTATATLGSTTVKAQIGNSFAQVNGNKIPMDIPPQMIQNRTMIPLRFFTENLGLSVSYDYGTRTVSVDTRRMIVSRDGGSVNRTGATLATAARKLVGSRYAWGGTSPATGFDCSGFVTYLTRQIGISLPRTTYEMFGTGMKIARADLQAGDLVFFTTDTNGASHVGIYDGNGSFIHAQSEETGVKVTALNNSWWAPRYLGARRVTNR